MGFGITIDVSGDRACFTRPELKVERVSYDVITPSAARGILEAVYWKPAIVWHIDSIDVINPIKFDTFRRNEVGSKASYALAKRAEKSDGVEIGIVATEDRQQRAMRYLRDVRYIITAHFDLTEKAGPTDTPEKHYNIALRRLRKGQCFNQPYLGCREFSVGSIKLVEEGEASPESCYQGTEIDLGYMLYDIDFAHNMQPLFYRPTMVNGHIDVASLRDEVVR